MDGPLLITAVAIWTYWIIVGVMGLAQRLRHGRRPGLVPRTAAERAMWLLWVPVIAAWIAFPALALDDDGPPWSLPEFATTSNAVVILRWIAAALAATCFVLTTVCWYRMGRHWAVAVVPGQEQPLIESGPFRFVRHPIYALSVAMIVLTAIVLPTFPMAITALTHVVLMHLKARSEEQFLTGVHGDAYRGYMARTGRFVPRVTTK